MVKKLERMSIDHLDKDMVKYSKQKAKVPEKSIRTTLYTLAFSHIV